MKFTTKIVMQTSPHELRKMAEQLEEMIEDPVAYMHDRMTESTSFEVLYRVDHDTTLKLIPGVEAFEKPSKPFAEKIGKPVSSGRCAQKKKKRAAPKKPASLRPKKKPAPPGKALGTLEEAAFSNPHKYCQNPDCQSSDLQITTNRYGTKIRCNKCSWSFFDRKKEKSS